MHQPRRGAGRSEMYVSEGVRRAHKIRKGSAAWTGNCAYRNAVEFVLDARF